MKWFCVKVLLVHVMYHVAEHVVATNRANGLWSDFYHYRGNLIFQDEFSSFNTTRWQHIITTWRGGNDEFEYYSDRPENRFSFKYSFRRCQPCDCYLASHFQ